MKSEKVKGKNRLGRGEITVEIHAGQRIHFVGVGGAGMSALAELLHRRGCRVSGTDRQASPLTDRLSRLGIDIHIGHTGDVIDDAEALVYTPAVAPDNPELAAAIKKGIPFIKRSRLLGDLAVGNPVVAVTGTHGKTTTTAMTAAVLVAGGLDPTVLVGGVLTDGETNLRVGSGRTWVIEADESYPAEISMPTASRAPACSSSVWSAPIPHPTSMTRRS